MDIAIFTLGTRGDVQPYAVLGKALAQRGHRVTLCTAKNFERMALSYGLDFVPVEADFQAVLESEEGKRMMKGNPFAIKRNLQTWIYPLITNSLSQFYSVATKNDLVLYHVKTLADTFADQFPEKMIRASVLPIVEPTRAFPNPALSGLFIPHIFSRLSYQFANLSIRLLSNPIGVFREKFGLSKKFQTPKVKNIYGISTTFLPMPTDYAPDSVFTGFWFEDGDDRLAVDLEEFLLAGSPPLVITFGSMPFKTRFNLASAIDKLTAQFRIRIIVVKGWGLEDTSGLESNPQVKVIKEAPYHKLFPRVKAVIHHGGIGTTAACLRAGIPFMVCPVLYPIGDQKFWGQRAFQMRLAVKPIPLSKLTEEQFLLNTKELLGNNDLYVNAEKISRGLMIEKGTSMAVEIIEKFKPA